MILRASILDRQPRLRLVDGTEYRPTLAGAWSKELREWGAAFAVAGMIVVILAVLGLCLLCALSALTWYRMGGRP